MLRRRPPEPRDPHELAAERASAGLGPFEPLPPSLHRFNRKRMLLFVLLGAVTVAVLRDGVGRGAPPAHGSCAKPAFAFDRTDVRSDGVVKWSVAGPADSTVVVTAAPDAKRLLGPVPLSGCKASGRFAVTLPAGVHTLHVRLTAPDGTSTEIGSARLEVNAPR